jgi:hypothetical protein
VEKLTKYWGMKMAKKKSSNDLSDEQVGIKFLELKDEKGVIEGAIDFLKG